MKKLKFNLKPVAAAVGATALTLASGAVMAQEAIDLTAITSAFSASDVITAVMAVAGVLAAIYATMTAARMALRWIRGG
ncbi:MULTISPECIES: hypothetical protein [Alcaligenaceae]|uniref:Phage coat protein n=2 Tax=Alcaligenaceae TaxID=506 RepID=A0A2V1JWR6_9BURK|nr:MULTISPECIES: hypothetical protein [Alcaligenaceae]PWF22930.1 hypothetical protein DD235_07910 [Corticimicrobacter populi]UPL20177.1 hypothetical protein MXF72_12155 [Alcaligenes faecalis]